MIASSDLKNQGKKRVCAVVDLARNTCKLNQCGTRRVQQKDTDANARAGGWTIVRSLGVRQLRLEAFRWRLPGWNVLRWCIM